MDDLSAYDRLAGIYDRLWAESSCRRFLPIVRQLVLSKLEAGSTVLDLCCGTGAMSRAIHAGGWRQIGVDGAPAMIALARQHAPTLDFRVQSCVDLQLERPCGAAVCLYDSLNHLRSVAELQQTLERVYAALGSGPFLFDLNTIIGYRARWRGSFSAVHDDLVVVARSEFDDAKGQARMKLTSFTPESAGWARVDLCLEQRCFDTPLVLQLLEEVGFRSAQAFDAEADLTMPGEVGRVVFLCQKE
jgi:SAM-dependent methyltransferase